jgi:hypothetical protein
VVPIDRVGYFGGASPAGGGAVGAAPGAIDGAAPGAAPSGGGVGAGAGGGGGGGVGAGAAGFISSAGGVAGWLSQPAKAASATMAHRILFISRSSLWT